MKVHLRWAMGLLLLTRATPQEDTRCLDDSTCTAPCEACCVDYFPDQATCDACIESECSDAPAGDSPCLSTALCNTYPPTPLPTGSIPLIATCCGGKDSGCSFPIGYGDGDCDSNEECAEGLLCGESNCAQFRDSAGWPEDDDGGWDTTDDCCYDPATPPTADMQEAGCCDRSALRTGRFLGVLGWLHWITFIASFIFGDRSRCNGIPLWLRDFNGVWILFVTLVLCVLQIAGGALILDKCDVDQGLGGMHLGIGIFGFVCTACTIAYFENNKVAPKAEPEPQAEHTL